MKQQQQVEPCNMLCMNSDAQLQTNGYEQAFRATTMVHENIVSDLQDIG